MENRFGVGTVLSLTFGIFVRNFKLMLIIACLSVIPSIIVTYLPESWGAMIASGLISLVLSYIIQGGLVFGIFQELTGVPMQLGQSFNVGLQRFFPVLGVGIVVGLLCLIGVFLLLVPGVVLYLMFWVAIPVTVVEKVGVGASMERSKDLTKGHRWQCLGIVAIVMVLSIIMSFIAAAAPFVLGAMGLVPGTWGMVLATYPVQVFTNGLPNAFGGILMAVAYYFLRSDAEGSAPEDLAEIFS